MQTMPITNCTHRYVGLAVTPSTSCATELICSSSTKRFSRPGPAELNSATREAVYSNDQPTVKAIVPDFASDEESGGIRDRKSTRLNSSHLGISYAVPCLK